VLSLPTRGDGPWHRAPAGPKAAFIAALILGVSLLPTRAWAGAAAMAVLVLAHAVPGVGLRALLALLRRTAPLLLFTLLSQALLLGWEPALINTARVTVAIGLASLLTLTTPLGELMTGVERGLRPLRRVGVDPERVALTLSLTMSTLPAMARAAQQVREAQRARGGGRSLRHFAVPFLVLALKHADELGEALAARGVR
jgi:biotin transport system permease protein